MPKFYHITTTNKKENLKNKLTNKKILFFSKRNQYWYIIMHQYQDRCKYEIDIPTTCFTTSFQTKKKNSIFKLTIDNFAEYKKKYHKLGRGENMFHDNTNIIGADLTIIETHAFQNKHWRKCTGRKNSLIVSELFIWKIPPESTIKLINCKQGDGNLLDDGNLLGNIFEYNFPINS
jgi:hypothetical protein